MTWKETCVMDIKMQLISDWLRDGQTITELSARYDVSRKTVYKWIGRYQQEGAAGLMERSRAPHRRPHAMDSAIAGQIIATKRRHMSFGPKKVMDRLRTAQPQVHWPADSTAGELLNRVGLVKKRRCRRPYPADPQPFELGHINNALWSVDYKGQYRSGDHRWCYPLTITDNASRYLIDCTAVHTTQYARARPVFERVFREYGLPEAILSDNGSPFASRAAGGLTRLSLWWVRQGIRVHRIRPGKPTQNARHERMHGSLHRAIGQQMRAAGIRRQQQILTCFREEYNELRSHESLNRQPPARVYTPSRRAYTSRLKPVEYDTSQRVRQVRHNGEIKFQGKLVYLSDLLATLPVGLQQVDEQRYEVRFSFHLLGYLNTATARLDKITHWHTGDSTNV